MTNETDIEQEIRDYLDNLEPCVYALSSPRHDGSTHAVFTNYDNAMEAGEKLKSTGCYEFHEYFVNKVPINPRIEIKKDWIK